MTFALGDDRLELELEPEERERRCVRGRLEATDPPLHTIEVVGLRERWSVHPDAAGGFALDQLPDERLDIVVRGPIGAYRLPPLE
jgi:hypothetical protein